MKIGATWQKGDIVVQAPDQLDVVAFRDPFVFRDANQWRMLVGTGLTGGVAAASSFSSNDLRTWTFDGIAAQRSGTQRQPVWTGTLWECPQIFAIDGRHVLVTSVWADDVLHHVAYGVGAIRTVSSALIAGVSSPMGPATTHHRSTVTATGGPV